MTMGNMTVFEKIEVQQKGKEETAAWMVGEQLKEICRADPHCADILASDLDNEGMSIDAAERKIKTWADAKHQKGKGNCVCVPPNEAEKILRDFYGLPPAGAAPSAEAVRPAPEVLDLADFL